MRTHASLAREDRVLENSCKSFISIIELGYSTLQNLILFQMRRPVGEFFTLTHLHSDDLNNLLFRSSECNVVGEKTNISPRPNTFAFGYESPVSSDFEVRFQYTTR